MSVLFPNVRVGEPICHKQLTVFPLFSEQTMPVDYALAADAITEGTLVVEEVSESGSVPTLSVTNSADRRVLFLEGEQLVGAKQNRVLNTSLLVAAKSSATIPVSCVEQGRWGLKSQHFGSSQSFSPANVRRALKASVNESVRRGDGYTSDQGQIWREVSLSQREHGVMSGTSAMEDIFETHRDKLAERQMHFNYVPGATGLAVALGNRLVTVDVFDKPSTCQKVWNRLLSGVLLDSFVTEPSVERISRKDVEGFLRNLATASWESVKPAGEGDEIRATTEDGAQASALYLAGHLVHESVVVAV